MNRPRWVLLALIALTAGACSGAGGAVSDFAGKARAEAKKWHSDAQLVEIDELKHYTDLVVWLTRPDNPYWRTGLPPLQAEYALIKQTAPREKWVWWTRIKQQDQWQYQLVDAATGTLTAECTSPPDGLSPDPRPVERCR